MRKHQPEALAIPVLPPFAGVSPLVRRFVDDVLNALASSDCVHDVRVEEVENEHRSGFIPYTEGGFDGIGYADLAYDHSTGSAPKIIQPYIDSALRDCEAEWDREHPAHAVARLFAPDPEEQGQLTLFGRSTERETWRERYYEFEDEWMREGGTYFYKVRAVYYEPDNSHNDTGDYEVCLCAGINTDFEYGRDHIPWLSAYGSDPHQTKWYFERTLRVSEITEDVVEALVREAVAKLAEA